jgi:hypothetical protein
MQPVESPQAAQLGVVEMKRPAFFMVSAFATLLFVVGSASAGGGHFHHHKVGFTGVSGFGVAPMGVTTFGVAPMGVASYGVTSYGVASLGVAPMSVGALGYAPLAAPTFNVAAVQPMVVQSEMSANAIDLLRLIQLTQLLRGIGRGTLPQVPGGGGVDLDGRIQGLQNRIAALEGDMTTVKANIAALQSNAEENRRTRILVQQHDEVLKVLWGNRGPRPNP